MNVIRRAMILLLPMLASCHFAHGRNAMLSQKQTDDAIAELRVAYAAFNRGDIDTAVHLLSPDVEWIEPHEFSGGGVYHGIEGAKRYLSRSRASAQQVISEPERFIPSGSRIVVFVHARVLPNGANAWQDVRLADVYTFRHGKVTQMRAFADRQKALHWVGMAEPPD
jgi:ketosteroid isomerase-like protein